MGAPTDDEIMQSDPETEDLMFSQQILKKKASSRSNQKEAVSRIMTHDVYVSMFIPPPTKRVLAGSIMLERLQHYIALVLIWTSA